MLQRKEIPAGKFALIVVSVLVSAFCSGKESRDEVCQPGLDEHLANETVLEVESRVYKNADFVDYLKSVYGNGYENLTPEVMSRLLDRFVDERILLEGAVRKGIKVSPEEERADRLDTVLIEKYIQEVVRDISVSDAEVESYYESHKKDFLLPERIKVSQIIVPTEEKAVEILRRSQDSDEEEFRRLASTESAGPEAARGGVMGIFKPGELPYDMEKVIFGLKEGEISRIVESPYGFHIFRLDSRNQPQLRPVSEVSGEIKAAILEAKVEETMDGHIKSLKETLDWHIHIGNLFFTYQESEK